MFTNLFCTSALQWAEFYTTQFWTKHLTRKGYEIKVVILEA